ncbi:MAG TPA: glutaredoxin family protein [Anaerolineae bacterium]|nr:glutaredoxin family protein [Anaerolineae bacterium]
MIEVIMYTKENCSLCDKAEALLAGLAGEWPHRLVKVDITMDDGLWERYRYAIPVLRVGEREVGAPLAEAEVVALLGGGDE